MVSRSVPLLVGGVASNLRYPTAGAIDLQFTFSGTDFERHAFDFNLFNESTDDWFFAFNAQLGNPLIRLTASEPTVYVSAAAGDLFDPSATGKTANHRGL